MRTRHEKKSRAHICRAHEMISRAHEIISRAHEIISRAHEIISREHEKHVQCIHEMLMRTIFDMILVFII